MKKYRKLPVEIAAIRNDGKWSTIAEWLQELAGAGEFIFEPGQAPPMVCSGHGEILIRTLEGKMLANVGDWIIQGVKGEFYPCKPDIFEATYEPVLEDES